MTRYVVKKNGKWAVVNANYKRSIKIFETQKEAIVFSRELLDTKRVVIQGKDNKFRTVMNVDPSKKDKRKVGVPIYVYRNMDKEVYKGKFLQMSLITLAIILTVLAIIFATLFALEATTWKNLY